MNLFIYTDFIIICVNSHNSPQEKAMKNFLVNFFDSNDITLKKTTPLKIKNEKNDNF